jgi:hypothetical protein
LSLTRYDNSFFTSQNLGVAVGLKCCSVNSIPVFSLSYLKIPVKVLREVTKIQRTFLWGGLLSKKKICWVKWRDICRPKKDGGLGIRDVRVMNTNLLAKWRWKLLMEGDEMWMRVVKAKYCVGVVKNANLEEEDFRLGSSVWWRDICR